MKKAIILTSILFAVFFVSTQNSFAQQGPCMLGVGNCSQGGSNTATSSADIYFNSNGAYYGRVTAYNGVFYKIEAGNTTIKTFKDSCKPNNSNGVAGYLCTFAQFNNNGQHIYSGYGLFYQNGVVYLMWTNENIGGTWRQIKTDWYAFRPNR